MHARVVRFTDVTPERIDEILSSVDEADGPPEGIDTTRITLFFDREQGTAIFVGLFETEEKLRAATKAFEEMDRSDTPGTRASVDLCEVKLDRTTP
ncbi:MAG TPA: hypothetical protein VK919_06815 [Solirubrobacterales bacterium]|nr:hypothetical protein [Solirubrobacterales bacterium]